MSKKDKPEDYHPDNVIQGHRHSPPRSWSRPVPGTTLVNLLNGNASLPAYLTTAARLEWPNEENAVHTSDWDRWDLRTLASPRSQDLLLLHLLVQKKAWILLDMEATHSSSPNKIVFALPFQTHQVV